MNIKMDWKTKSRLLRAGIWLAGFALVWMGLTVFVGHACASLPEGFELSDPAGLNVSFRELLGAELPTVALSAPQERTVRYGDKALSVEGLYALGPADRLLPFAMKYGAFFPDSDAGPEESRYVILSDSLSQKLFFTDDSVGRSCSIDGAAYTVSGVYASRDSLLSRLSNGGAEPMLFPWQLGASAPVESVFFQTDEWRFVDSAREYLDTLRAPSPPPAYLADYGETRAVLRQTVDIVGYSAGLLLAALLASYLWKMRGAARLAIRTKNTQALVIQTALAAGLLALAIGCLLHFSFSFHLPSSWTPKDNVFDLSFYGNRFVEEWRQCVFGGSPDPYRLTSLLAAVLAGGLTLLTLLMLLGSFIRAELCLFSFAKQRRDEPV